MIKKISLSKAEHRGQTWLRIKFPYDKEAGALINNMLNATWSQTCKSWLFPFEKQSIENLRQHFEEIVFEDDESRGLEIPLIPKTEYGKEEDILAKDINFIITMPYPHWDPINKLINC